MRILHLRMRRQQLSYDLDMCHVDVVAQANGWDKKKETPEARQGASTGCVTRMFPQSRRTYAMDRSDRGSDVLGEEIGLQNGKLIWKLGDKGQGRHCQIWPWTLKKCLALHFQAGQRPAGIRCE